MRPYPVALMTKEARRKNKLSIKETYVRGRVSYWKGKSNPAVSLALKGKKRPDMSKWLRTAYEEGRKTVISMKGNSNPAWKGKEAGYHAIHKWLYKRKERSNICEFCETVVNVQFANLSGKYLRDVNDFIELCRRCHYWFDRDRSLFLV